MLKLFLKSNQVNIFDKTKHVHRHQQYIKHVVIRTAMINIIRFCEKK